MERNKSVSMTKSIRDYLLYVQQRPAYLKQFVGNCECVEIKYYEETQKRIKKWAKRHRVFYQYISGMINAQEAIEYMGVSERVFYRLMGKQKIEFLSFLQETENELTKEYSFTPFTDDFMRVE